MAAVASATREPAKVATPLIDVARLTVRYGMVTALSGVDLHVDRGEIVAVLGPNGAGKSTLLRTIAGVHRPAHGAVSLAGARLPAGVPEEVARRGVSLVPEGRRIFGPLTVTENLRLGATPRPGGTEQANLERVFARFPVLGERRDQVAGTLSGGEQQQLAIARALMAEPRVILYDEPSLGLAPRITNQIFDLLGELRDTGVTSLLVEQNARRALRLADRGYVLASGRVVATGTAPELEARDLARLYLGEVGAA